MKHKGTVGGNRRRLGDAIIDTLVFGIAGYIFMTGFFVVWVRWSVLINASEVNDPEFQTAILKSLLGWYWHIPVPVAIAAMPLGLVIFFLPILLRTRCCKGPVPVPPKNSTGNEDDGPEATEKDEG